MIHHGDALTVLKTLPDASVQCCVTSPPYWGLRDYGVAGQIGLERTPDEYVGRMVEVFREVRRVLKADGVLWLNLGSSYARDEGKGRHKPGDSGKQNYIIERGGGRAASGGTYSSRSRQPKCAPSCDSDGTAPQDSMPADFACSGLCDGCLADFQSHRDRIAGMLQPSEQSEPPSWPKGRDTAPSGCASASPDASLPGAQASSTLESWLQHRGACSRCDSRASSLSGLRSSSDGVLPFAGMSWLNYTRTLKQKDLVPIPWMVAMALQADGWYLRCDVIWSKPNPMPESVTDRPTKAHEYIFLLTKSERYYYDSDAIKEPGVYAGPNGAQKSPHAQGFGRRSPEQESARQDKQRGHGRRHAGFNDRWDAMERAEQTGVMRNKRSVWSIATRPFTERGETSRRVPVALDAIDGDTKRTTSPDCPLHGDHAALVPNGSCGGREGASPSHTERTSVRPAQEPFLGSEPIGSHHGQGSSAGSLGSSVPEHEAPATSHSTGNRRRGRAPATIPPCTPSEKTPSCTERIEGERGSLGSAVRTSESSTEPVGSGDHPSVQTASRIGGSLSCSCEHYRIVTEQISHFATFPEEIPTVCILAGSRPGDVVLDPFNGAGTVGVVCAKTGRSYIGVELNPQYVEMANRRIGNVAPLFNQEPSE